MPRSPSEYSDLHDWSVAVTPTFPSRETLDRLRFRPLDVGVGIFVILLIYVIVRVGAGGQGANSQLADDQPRPF